MPPTARRSQTGIVFRRLDGETERREAARLLPPCRLPDHDGTCTWFGLCDLTAEDPLGGPAGVVVVRATGGTTARLCGLGVSGDDRERPVARRLVCEVADRLRASGFDGLTAPPWGDRAVAALLAEIGFLPCGPAQEEGWSQLSL
jgi:ribosomal protein S18 acetylase RimI-like enzyme